MSLSTKAKKKISNITYCTGLLGFSQYENKEEAISIINLFQGDCMNDNGTFKKTGHRCQL